MIEFRRAAKFRMGWSMEVRQTLLLVDYFLLMLRGLFGETLLAVRLVLGLTERGLRAPFLEHIDNCNLFVGTSCH